METLKHMRREAGCSGHRHAGRLLPKVEAGVTAGSCSRSGAAPGSGKAWGDKGSTAGYHPLSCGLCSKEGNCSGRNLCFNIFLFVCLKQVPTSLRKPRPTFPGKHGGVFFLRHLLFTFLHSYFLSFIPSFPRVSVSFLPLSLSRTCFKKIFLSLFLNFVLDIMTFSRSAPVLNQIPLRGHACQSLVTYGHFGVPVRRGGRGAEVAE